MANPSRIRVIQPLAMSESWIPRTFRLLAEDLGLIREPEVQRAIGLLTARKYKSFLILADSWTLQTYPSSGSHRAWNQLACLLKKYPFDDPSIDTKKASMDKFHAAEWRCKRINQRFSMRRRLIGRPLPYEQYIHSARMFIQSVLGVSPNMERIRDLCDFGPGASVGVHGNATHKAAKLSKSWTVTPACAPIASSIMVGDHHIWEHLIGSPVCYDLSLFREKFSQKLKYVNANKIITVPKTALVDRTIAIEPTLNGYVQKGIDLFMRQKLRRYGIDLSDQSRNQFLAQKGSESKWLNPLCTIDLSAASDSISIELVRELLPPDWFNLLNRVRSPSFILEGDDLTEHRYHKFTSMGNGFCFPLETLIFSALVHSVYEVTKDRGFSVYGDDIIVRQSSALLVIELLDYCGFKTNKAKTFLFGPFRESCGADYFEGVNVRPYYLDKVPTTWGDYFGILNGLRRVSLGHSDLWRDIFLSIPISKRFVRPYDGSDVAISVDQDDFMSSPHVRWNHHEQRWSWREFVTKAIRDSCVFTVGADLYGLLRGQRSSAFQVEYTFRRKTRTSQRWV
jgi:hypothetical protein